MINLGEFRKLTADLPDTACFGLKVDGGRDDLDLVLNGVTLDLRGEVWVDIHVIEESERDEDEDGEDDAAAAAAEAAATLRAIEECRNSGLHLTSCDADGYCNLCGEQDA